MVFDLERDLDAIANLPQKDFHPNTSDKIQDLIHPSLFPYIHNKSFITNESKKQAYSKQPTKDEGRYKNSKKCRSPLGFIFFDRRVETSDYQWLPATFEIDNNGKSKITSYINNLEWSTHKSLYSSIEKIFDFVHPLLSDSTELELTGKKLQVK